MKSLSQAQRRLVAAATYVAIWTLIALLSAVEAYVSQAVYDTPIPWSLALSRSLKEWYAWGFMGLGVGWLCEKVPFSSTRLSRWLLVQIPFGFIVALAYVALLSALLAGERSVQTGEVLTFTPVFQKFALHYTMPNVMTYWLLVAAHVGWASYRQSRERERQAAALATELVQARLEALRMQINPHFFFNTLNTISALVHENPDAADRMIVRLSELLRRTFDQVETQEVPLREEVDFLKGYLEIEQVRFADRLRVRFDIAPETGKLLVPQLVLQPLVENAIRHGIEPRAQPGEVAISAHLEDGSLVLRVRDNGAGLPVGHSSPPGGIGLSNVRSRLAHLHGAAQSCVVRNAPGGGVEAVLRLPASVVPREVGSRVVVMTQPRASRVKPNLPGDAQLEHSL